MINWSTNNLCQFSHNKSLVWLSKNCSRWLSKTQNRNLNQLILIKQLLKLSSRAPKSISSSCLKYQRRSSRKWFLTNRRWSLNLGFGRVWINPGCLSKRRKKGPRRWNRKIGKLCGHLSLQSRHLCFRSPSPQGAIVCPQILKCSKAHRQNRSSYQASAVTRLLRIILTHWSSVSPKSTPMKSTNYTKNQHSLRSSPHCTHTKPQWWSIQWATILTSLDH